MTPQYLFLPQTKVIISRSVKYCWVDCLVAKLSNAMHLLWTTLKKLVVWNVPTCTNCKWDNLSPLMQKKGQITPCRPTHSDQCNYSSFKKCQFWIPNRCFRNPINFILGTLFGLKEKELFTMCWISPLEPFHLSPFPKWNWISKTSIGNSEVLDVRFPNNCWKSWTKLWQFVHCVTTAVFSKCNNFALLHTLSNLETQFSAQWEQ